MISWASDGPEAPFTAHGAKTEVGGVSDARDGGRNFPGKS